MSSNKISLLIERYLTEDAFPESSDPEAVLESGLDEESSIGIEDLVTQEDIANQEKINAKYKEVFVDAYGQIKKLADIITMLKDPFYNESSIEERNLIQNIALLSKLKPEEKNKLASGDKLIGKASNSISEVITIFDSLASGDKELSDAISKVTGIEGIDSDIDAGGIDSIGGSLEDFNDIDNEDPAGVGAEDPYDLDSVGNVSDYEDEFIR